MFEVSINGKQVKAEFSFYTAQLYEAEFQSDIIRDLFAVQSTGDSAVRTEDDGSVTIDFTMVNWNSVTKALWAAVKTANEKTPAYAQWLKKAKGANMWALREALLVEAADCFFRTAPAGEEA